MPCAARKQIRHCALYPLAYYYGSPTYFFVDNYGKTSPGLWITLWEVLARVVAQAPTLSVSFAAATELSRSASPVHPRFMWLRRAVSMKQRRHVGCWMLCSEVKTQLEQTDII